jgi:hypothetical protein
MVYREEPAMRYGNGLAIRVKSSCGIAEGTR